MYSRGFIVHIYYWSVFFTNVKYYSPCRAIIHFGINPVHQPNRFEHKQKYGMIIFFPRKKKK
jgi:hypothetical protein